MARHRDMPGTRANAVPAATVDGENGVAPRGGLRRDRRVPRWRARSAAGLGLALLAAVAVIFAANRGIAPSGTSAGSDLDHFFAQHPALRRIEDARLFQEPDLSRTVAEYTVTLRRAYAGDGRVTLIWTVARPPGVPAVAFEPRLTDGAGAAFAALVGAGVGTAEATYFDASAVQDGRATLDLRLELTPRGPWPDRRPVGDPLVFAFGVPFTADPPRLVAVGQTVTASGVAVTLRQVTLGQAERLAIICFTPPDSTLPGWSLVADLDGAPSGGSGRAVAEMDPSCARYRFGNDAQPTAPGAHTLVVRELLGQGPGAPSRLAGPWVFHFAAP